jgi:hypothetical protein
VPREQQKRQPHASLATVRLIRARYKVIRAQYGAVTPRNIVDDARDPKSPLHRFFEWDNTAAAEAYRLSQAGDLMRRVQVYVTHEGVKQPARVYVSIVRNDIRQYEETTKAMTNPVSRQALLDQMKRDVESVIRRYKLFTYFSKSIKLLEKAIEELDKAV